MTRAFLSGTVATPTTRPVCPRDRPPANIRHTALADPCQTERDNLQVPALAFDSPLVSILFPDRTFKTEISRTPNGRKWPRLCEKSKRRRIWGYFDPYLIVDRRLYGILRGRILKTEVSSSPGRSLARGPHQNRTYVERMVMGPRQVGSLQNEGGWQILLPIKIAP